jgi:hypothetical protein
MSTSVLPNHSKKLHSGKAMATYFYGDKCQVHDTTMHYNLQSNKNTNSFKNSSSFIQKMMVKKRIPLFVVFVIYLMTL